jgi:hypothetical protein
LQQEECTMSILDLDNYTDAVSDAVDAIGDAGDLIGGILKSVSPILGAIPGLGTAFAVAVYAAGAIAAKDKITDAMIGTASAAMPPGIPRIAFDGATNITKDIVEGRNVGTSAINACRQAADKAGGAPAVAAFESGIAVISGGRIDQRAIDQGRAFALQGGGQAAAASYDAGVAIAEGKGADQVVIEVARGYINQMGGAVALAAFDTGVALGYGKTLQEAGYVGLHTFARGNIGMEKVLNFVEQVGKAKSLGMGVQQFLEWDLADDFLQAVAPGGMSIASSFIDDTLKPYIDAIRENLKILEVPAGDLAQQWGIDEAVIRAAQALMRSGDGTVDDDLLNNLKGHRVPTFDFSERNVATNDGYAESGRRIINRGAKWKGRLLSDIRDGSSFTITHDALDGVNLSEPRQIVRMKETYEIDDGWRRGFEIAIGLCEGSSVDGPEQQQVKASLVGQVGRGFVAGQEVQFNRTNPFGILKQQAANASTRQGLALAKPKAITQSVSAASASGVHAVVLDKPEAVSQSVSAVSASGAQELALDKSKATSQSVSAASRIGRKR